MSLTALAAFVLAAFAHMAWLVLPGDSPRRMTFAVLGIGGLWLVTSCELAVASAFPQTWMRVKASGTTARDG